jgi:hypothetical protein
VQPVDQLFMVLWFWFFVLGGFMKEQKDGCGDLICPAIFYLVPVTKPFSDFLEIHIGILYKKLSSQHEMAH